MKLLSNFDTNLDEKIYEKEKEKYGEEYVMLVKRAKIFFYIHVLLPSVIFFIVTIAVLIGGAMMDLGDSGNTLKWIMISIVLILYLLGVAFKVILNYIDYDMDYAVVTPDGINYLEQTGFFSRNSETIDADKVKSISVKKSGILKSIFNFGALVFLSEGDQHHGDIELDYMHAPNQLKENIIDIINFGWQKTGKDQRREEK